jgi:hypothetical protein
VFLMGPVVFGPISVVGLDDALMFVVPGETGMTGAL